MIPPINLTQIFGERKPLLQSGNLSYFGDLLLEDTLYCALIYNSVPIREMVYEQVLAEQNLQYPPM